MILAQQQLCLAILICWSHSAPHPSRGSRIGYLLRMLVTSTSRLPQWTDSCWRLDANNTERRPGDVGSCLYNTDAVFKWKHYSCSLHLQVCTVSTWVLNLWVKNNPKPCARSSWKRRCYRETDSSLTAMTPITSVEICTLFSMSNCQIAIIQKAWAE